MALATLMVTRTALPAQEGSVPFKPQRLSVGSWSCVPAVEAGSFFCASYDDCLALLARVPDTSVCTNSRVPYATRSWGILGYVSYIHRNDIY